jgi:serine/threonine protein kinase
MVLQGHVWLYDGARRQGYLRDMIGRKLDLYEVVAKLGEGGMDEVYRARDTRLGRDVALKILPRAFSGDPDRPARHIVEEDGTESIRSFAELSAASNRVANFAARPRRTAR